MFRAMTWGKVLKAFAALRMRGKELELELELELVGLEEDEELVVRGRRFREWITYCYRQYQYQY